MIIFINLNCSFQDESACMDENNEKTSNIRQKVIPNSFLKVITLNSKRGLTISGKPAYDSKIYNDYDRINTIVPKYKGVNSIDYKKFFISYADKIKTSFPIYFPSHVIRASFPISINIGQDDYVYTDNFTTYGNMIGSFIISEDTTNTNKLTIFFQGNDKSYTKLTHSWSIPLVRTISHPPLFNLKKSHSIDLNKHVDGIMTGKIEDFDGLNENIYFNVPYSKDKGYHIFLEHITSDESIESNKTPDFDIFLSLGNSTPIYPSSSSYYLKSEEGLGLNNRGKNIPIDELIALNPFHFNGDFSKIWITVKNKTPNGGHFRLRVNQIDKFIELKVNVDSKLFKNNVFEVLTRYTLVRLSEALYSATEGRIFLQHITVDSDGCLGWCDLYFVKELPEASGKYYSIPNFIDLKYSSILGLRAFAATFTHEYGHRMGLDDEYDLSKAKPGLRTGHSIMASSKKGLLDYSVSRNHGIDKQYDMDKKIYALGWPNGTTNNWSTITSNYGFSKPSNIVNGETPDPYKYQQEVFCRFLSNDPNYPGRGVTTSYFYNRLLSRVIYIRFKDFNNISFSDYYRYPTNCNEIKNALHKDNSKDYQGWFIKTSLGSP